MLQMCMTACIGNCIWWLSGSGCWRTLHAAIKLQQSKISVASAAMPASKSWLQLGPTLDQIGMASQPSSQREQLTSLGTVCWCVNRVEQQL